MDELQACSGVSGCLERATTWYLKIFSGAQANHAMLTSEAEIWCLIALHSPASPKAQPQVALLPMGNLEQVNGVVTCYLTFWVASLMFGDNVRHRGHLFVVTTPSLNSWELSGCLSRYQTLPWFRRRSQMVPSEIVNAASSLPFGMSDIVRKNRWTREGLELAPNGAERARGLELWNSESPGW
jgi:hypothetical protein